MLKKKPRDCHTFSKATVCQSSYKVDLLIRTWIVAKSWNLAKLGVKFSWAIFCSLNSHSYIDVRGSIKIQKAEGD